MGILIAWLKGFDKSICLKELSVTQVTVGVKQLLSFTDVSFCIPP